MRAPVHRKRAVPLGALSSAFASLKAQVIFRMHYPAGCHLGGLMRQSTVRLSECNYINLHFV
jgi:hypothetical protein